MLVKERLNNTNYEHFTAFNGLLKNGDFQMNYVKLTLPEKLVKYLE